MDLCLLKTEIITQILTAIAHENYWSEPYKVFEIIFGNTVEPSEGVVLEREGFTVTVDDFEKIVDG